MNNFAGRIAVVTGGGTGMGRELVRQLSAEGCHVAMCDVSEENMAETMALAAADAPDGTRITSFVADVADETQMNAFRDAVVADHQTEHVNLLFNNAGIGGAGSFVSDERASWERTFGICWGGVYNGCRVFLDLIIASDEGYIVNTSSINGFWASLGPDVSHTSYSAAKFAVKGFTEALVTDLRLNAPHVKAAVVMPGHIGTSIAINSGEILGPPDIPSVRKRLAERGLPVDALTDEQIIEAIEQRATDFRDNAPMTAAEASTVILEGVRADRWRILVGDDAHAIDQLVRSDPEAAYDVGFIERIHETGHLQSLVDEPSSSD